MYNHELCYATSKYPDRDYVYGGTIVSNGDIGLNGRKEKDRLNFTATTHGSIECINGEWYVFYHRQTHGSDYSRQACAEKIHFEEDGSIRQVEITSCGLNNGDLKGTGEYMASICCNLTNGKMPHLSNGRVKDIPMIYSDEEGQYIKDMNDNTVANYKYFDLSSTEKITVTLRGKGTFAVKVNDEEISSLNIDCDNWNEVTLDIKGDKHSKLSLFVKEGLIDVRKFELR